MAQMKYEVRNRFTGDVQFTAEIECDKDASTSIKLGLAVKWAVKADANLAGAYLARANLAGAYLARANLARANLADANLADAYLADANLAGANLAGAKGLNPYTCTPLLMLHDQVGKIRAYKLVNSKGEGIYNGGLKYEIGKSVSVDDADCDPNTQCAAGINIADISWVCREWREGMDILLVEHTAKDIACIPTATDGKYRVHRCKVVRKMDLEQLGLVKPAEEKAAA